MLSVLSSSMIPSFWRRDPRYYKISIISFLSPTCPNLTGFSLQIVHLVVTVSIFCSGVLSCIVIEESPTSVGFGKSWTWFLGLASPHVTSVTLCNTLGFAKFGLHYLLVIFSNSYSVLYPRRLKEEMRKPAKAPGTGPRESKNSGNNCFPFSSEANSFENNSSPLPPHLHSLY